MSGESKKTLSGWTQRITDLGSRVRLEGLGRPMKQPDAIQRHPAFNATGNAWKAAPDMGVPAVARKMSREGYVVYNINDSDSVFVRMEPEEAYFDDDAPAIVRLGPGEFAGGSPARVQAPVAIVEEEVIDPVQYSDPSDLFLNAIRRAPEEAVDFEEVLVKAPATRLAPMALPLSGAPNAVSCTSSDAAPAASQSLMIAYEKPEPAYDVVDIPPAPKAPAAPAKSFKSIRDEILERSGRAVPAPQAKAPAPEARFGEPPVFPEPPAQRAAPLQAISPKQTTSVSLAEPPKVQIGIRPAFMTSFRESPAAMHVGAMKAATVAVSPPRPIEIVDDVGDILKLSDPGLARAEEMLDPYPPESLLRADADEQCSMFRI